MKRSNVVLSGIRHEVVGELDHGAPYGGFIQIRLASNVTVEGCVFTAHKLYWTQGHGGPSPMGSYDLAVNDSVGVKIVDCRQTTDIDDGRQCDSSCPLHRDIFSAQDASKISFRSKAYTRWR